MTEQNQRLGIALMMLATVIFAIQDAVSRYLASEYNVYLIIMIRYWFFAAFVITLASRRPGGLRATARTRQPLVQGARGLLLVMQICTIVYGFTQLGLIESHAVLACSPLLVAALSGPVLGERVGWRRWSAIGIGFIGVLIILQPGVGALQPLAVIPLIAALLFALYGLLTRYAARADSAATSFFWTGVVGAVGITLVGVWHWEPMAPRDWLWMGMLCLTGVSGHFTLIKCYEVAEASAVQPFAYLQLVFISALGVLIFEEAIRPNVAAGVVIVVSAGLFTLWRERRAA
ncbi:DMT family transporter [Roseovarius spongiae]|uniref:DMT family transporter n=1 Tax=Roseovarius spongiae TaxID=2320272 RepID=A0A3A8BAR2_9RHOB|nr:DMT family transporter [Roseovarius spongiae]RKF16324.1 DMT family transporter [Roseovarius spongiae]